MDTKAINALHTCVNTIRNCIFDNPDDKDLREVYEDLYDVTCDYVETDYPDVLDDLDKYDTSLVECDCRCTEDIDVIVTAHNMLVVQMNSEFDKIDKSFEFSEEAISKTTDILDQIVQNQKEMFERIKKLEERKPVENHYHTHYNKTNEYTPPYPWYITTCNISGL